MSILDEIKVNRTSTHMVRSAAIELQKKTKVIMGEYVERIKRPGEVSAPALSIWERDVYRSGDGDSMRQVPREGSLDAFSLPSRGNRT
jgi:hypothetical protein